MGPDSIVALVGAISSAITAILSVFFNHKASAHADRAETAAVASADSANTSSEKAKEARAG